jgi:hypothetical protein
LLYLATVPTTGFAYGYVAFMPKDDPAALLCRHSRRPPALGWTVLLGAAGFVIYLLMASLFHRLLAPGRQGPRRSAGAVRHRQRAARARRAGATDGADGASRRGALASDDAARLLRGETR